jgi:hypothetical protein
VRGPRQTCRRGGVGRGGPRHARGRVGEGVRRAVACRLQMWGFSCLRGRQICVKGHGHEHGMGGGGSFSERSQRLED